jgi:hypothetical protein
MGNMGQLPLLAVGRDLHNGRLLPAPTDLRNLSACSEDLAVSKTSRGLWRRALPDFTPRFMIVSGS